MSEQITPVASNTNTAPEVVVTPVAVSSTAPLFPAPPPANPDKTVDASGNVIQKETEVVPVTPPPAAKIVPETYDLKLPDGSHLDPSSLSKIAAAAKARGLSNEEAQAEVVRESASAASYVETLNSKMQERQNQWVNTVRSDAEIGGANFEKSVSNAQRALNKYGTPELLKELNDSGLGNHPEMVRTFARIGALMADDSAVLAGTQPSSGKSALEVLYDKK